MERGDLKLSLSWIFRASWIPSRSAEGEGAPLLKDAESSFSSARELGQHTAARPFPVTSCGALC